MFIRKIPRLDRTLHRNPLVHGLHVLLDVRLVVEPLVAQTAGVRTFPRVHAQVLLQFAVGVIRLRTQVAEKPPRHASLPTVHLPHVQVQGAAVLVLTLAHVARERPEVRVRQHVLGQHRPADAPPVAEVARERTLPGVYLRVRVEVRLQGKPPRAVGAHVLPLAAVGVHAHAVLVQVGGRVESFRALRAAVRAHVRVDLLVVVQVARRDEPLAAVPANVGAVAGVVTLVRRQVEHAGELAAALVAPVGFLRRVDVAHVPIQEVLRVEFRRALLALVRSFYGVHQLVVSSQSGGGVETLVALVAPFLGHFLAPFHVFLQRSDRGVRLAAFLAHVTCLRAIAMRRRDVLREYFFIVEGIVAVVTRERAQRGSFLEQSLYVFALEAPISVVAL